MSTSWLTFFSTLVGYYAQIFDSSEPIPPFLSIPLPTNMFLSLFLSPSIYSFSSFSSSPSSHVWPLLVHLLTTSTTISVSVFFSCSLSIFTSYLSIFTFTISLSFYLLIHFPLQAPLSVRLRLSVRLSISPCLCLGLESGPSNKFDLCSPPPPLFSLPVPVPLCPSFSLSLVLRLLPSTLPEKPSGKNTKNRSRIIKEFYTLTKNICYYY